MVTMTDQLVEEELLVVSGGLTESIALAEAGAVSRSQIHKHIRVLS